MKDIANVNTVPTLATDDGILCVSGSAVKQITMENLLKEVSTEMSTPHYTLEKTSNPEFDVINSTALTNYLAQVGGYMMLFKNGKAYAAKLMSDDWNYFADGTPVDSAAKYETMVHFPTCHFKAQGKTMNFGGLTPIDGGHSFHSPQWIGAYKMYVDGSGIGHSRPDVAPAHSKTMSAFWNCAQALHSEAGLANYGFHCLINCLFQAKYGNLNSQTVIGSGGQTSSWEAWRDIPMGSTIAIGDGSGECATTMDGQKEVKLFGLEGLWGKLFEFRPGVRFSYDDTTKKRTATVYEGNIVSNTATGRSFEIPMNGNGYPKAMLLGEHWDMLPEAVGGSSSTYYCDYWYESTGGALLFVGGYADLGAYCGVSSANSNPGFSRSGTSIGARLAFYGETEIIEGSELTQM